MDVFVAAQPTLVMALPGDPMLKQASIGGTWPASLYYRVIGNVYLDVATLEQVTLAKTDAEKWRELLRPIRLWARLDSSNYLC